MPSAIGGSFHRLAEYSFGDFANFGDGAAHTSGGGDGLGFICDFDFLKQPTFLYRTKLNPLKDCSKPGTPVAIMAHLSTIPEA